MRLFLFAALCLIIACNQHQEFSSTSRDSQNNSTQVGEPNTLPPSLYVTETWTQNASESSKVDLLLIVDTSESMFDEITAMRKALVGFVETFKNKNIDLCAAVIPGQADETGGLIGQKFKDVSCIKKGVNLFKYNLESDLTYDLLASFGEAGLYALKESFLNPEKLSHNKSKGFFRDGATLAVIFVSDENDIGTSAAIECNDSELVPNYSFEPMGLSNFAYCYEARIRAKYYSTLMGRTYHLVWDFKKVFDEIIRFQGALGFYAAVVGYQGLPGFIESPYQELAHGYNDFVKLAKGDLVDLSLTQDQNLFNEAFKSFSENIAIASSFQSVFDIKEDACEGTLYVYVGNKKVDDFIVEGKRVRLLNARDLGKNGSLVQITYRPVSKNCS